MVGIIFAIVGLVFLITGKIKVSKKRSVEGIWARLLGLYFLGAMFVPQLIVNLAHIQTQKVATILSLSYLGIGILIILVLIIVVPETKENK